MASGVNRKPLKMVPRIESLYPQIMFIDQYLLVENLIPPQEKLRMLKTFKNYLQIIPDIIDMSSLPPIQEKKILGGAPVKVGKKKSQK